MIGQNLTADVIDAVAGAAYDPAKPMDNADLNHAWREKRVRVYVRRGYRNWRSETSRKGSKSEEEEL